MPKLVKRIVQRGMARANRGMAIPDDRVELIARKSQKLNNPAIDQFITWIPMACRRKEDIH
jgi:hypothetical protein